MRVERGCVGGPVLSADQVAGAVRTFLKRDAAGSTTEKKVFQYCEASFVVQLHPSLRRKIIEYTAERVNSLLRQACAELGLSDPEIEVVTRAAQVERASPDDVSLQEVSLPYPSTPRERNPCTPTLRPAPPSPPPTQ